MTFTLRRLVVVTSRINPPIRNMQWRATLGGDPLGDQPLGLGSTEPEAVRDLYEEIAFREEKTEEQRQQEAFEHYGEIEGD